MDLVERLYAAAEHAGLLVAAQVSGRTVAVGFSAPDQTLLDGLVRAADYTIRYPASTLPELAAGDTVVINSHSYQVRDVRAVGDGSERLADLTRL